MRSKNKVRISICIPTFNRADLLSQTLQSVANQTIRPYEVIVVDNNSVDGSVELIGQKFSEVVLIANAQNVVAGMPKQEPVLIGVTEKAKQVMIAGTDKPMIQMIDAGKAADTGIRMISNE